MALIHSTPSTLGPHAWQPATTGGDEEQRGEEAQVPQDEEEIGQAGEGEPLRRDVLFGQRPDGEAHHGGEQAQRGQHQAAPPGCRVRRRCTATQATTNSCGHARAARSQFVTGLIQGGWSRVTVSW